MSRKEQKSIFIPCDCHTHGIQMAEVDLDDWFEIVITPYYLAGGEYFGIWSRIKGAFSVLFRGRWTSHQWIDIISPEYAQQIVDYLTVFIAKCDKGQYGRITDFEDKT